MFGKTSRQEKSRGFDRRTLKDLQNLDVEAVAKAIEADAGESIPDLRQALVEAKAGKFAASHTPEQIAARKRGRPLGSVAEETKAKVNLRLDPDVVERLRASGKGWQSRVNSALRADLDAGRI